MVEEENCVGEAFAMSLIVCVDESVALDYFEFLDKAK